MATEDSSSTAARTSVRTTNARTHKTFIVALLLHAILAGLIHLESLQGTEPPRTTWTASRRVRNRSQPRGLRGIGRKARTESKKSKSGSHLAPGSQVTLAERFNFRRCINPGSIQDARSLR